MTFLQRGFLGLPAGSKFAYLFFVFVTEGLKKYLEVLTGI